jgi:hypothetical protein
MTILAITRMKESRVCIAGIDDQGRWLRPRPTNGLLERDDLVLTDGAALQALDVVELPVVRYVPDPPHVEDLEVDWDGVRVVGHVADQQRQDALNRWIDRPFNMDRDRVDRSLWLAPSEGIMARRFENDDRPSVKISFCCEPDGEWFNNLKVTSIEDEQLLLDEFARLGAKELKKTALRRLFGCREFFLAIGLTREYQDKYWPMVIGVHPVRQTAGQQGH